MNNFLLEERLLNPNQSCSCPSGSSVNQLLAIIKFLKHLIVLLLLNLIQSFQIYQKHFTKFGMKACLIKSTLWVFLESFITLVKTIFEEDFRGFFKMDKICHGGLFNQVFAKVSFWAHLIFLIYINELFNNSKSNVKLFADYVSLFTVVKDKNESANVLKNYLQPFSI